MAAVQVMFRILLFVGLLSTRAAAEVARSSNCKDRCGDIAIPFPFGIGSSCYLSEWYEIVCQNDTIPLLKKINAEVIDISLPTLSDNYDFNDGTIIVNVPLIYSNENCTSGNTTAPPVSLKGSPFFYYEYYNNFYAMINGTGSVLVGCKTGSVLVGCKTECQGGRLDSHSNCIGKGGCCSSSIPTPSYLQEFRVDFLMETPKLTVPTTPATVGECKYAFLGYREYRNSNLMDLNDLIALGSSPVVHTWGVLEDTDLGLNLTKTRDDAVSCIPQPEVVTINGSMRLQCACRLGYGGNPYHIGGCKDIDECEQGTNPCPELCVNTIVGYSCKYNDNPPRTTGLVSLVSAGLGSLVLALVSWWSYKIIMKRREIKRKQKFFKRNGGILLQQQLSSPEGNVEKRLFNSKELRQATNNFNNDRILGQGGQGTVYKGMLTDGRIVAVKKSKAIDEGKVEPFINEVVILSQINHRNVVKLLGCCLETEVPLLVYEFIPNGTLYQFLHESDEGLAISWEVRVRLATEVAGSLSYLHSAASIPIYHRDIKSSNILMDEKYQAKIADFGTSRLVSLEQTHVTTLVQGTFGYLDPEYFRSSQFTDKSDVYSFGVVLVELLTRQKPVSSQRVQEGKGLAAYFVNSMEENQLFDILDPQVVKEAEEEEIVLIAKLANRCLDMNGRNRPTMKEVARVLEGIRQPVMPPDNIQFDKEFSGSVSTYQETEASDVLKSTCSEVFGRVTSISDADPLIYGRTW